MVVVPPDVAKVEDIYFVNSARGADDPSVPPEDGGVGAGSKAARVAIGSPILPSPLRSCWKVLSSAVKVGSDPDRTEPADWNIPALSVVHTLYWFALPFFHAS